MATSRPPDGPHAEANFLCYPESLTPTDQDGRTRRLDPMFRRTVAVVLVLIVLAPLPGAGRPAGAQGPDPAPPPRRLDPIRPSEDRTHFVRAGTDERIVIWGFNYDRDDAGRLLEDYWGDEWATVADDFREMKGLGANVVRVHLQLARFMKVAERPDEASLARLGNLVRLAEQTGLYLDVTGLGCYHKRDVPEWYYFLEESARWDVQARFW